MSLKIEKYLAKLENIKYDISHPKYDIYMQKYTQYVMTGGVKTLDLNKSEDLNKYADLFELYVMFNRYNYEINEINKINPTQTINTLNFNSIDSTNIDSFKNLFNDFLRTKGIHLIGLENSNINFKLLQKYRHIPLMSSQLFIGNNIYSNLSSQRNNKQYNIASIIDNIPDMTYRKPLLGNSQSRKS
jgi:hypothetical protein